MGMTMNSCWLKKLTLLMNDFKTELRISLCRGIYGNYRKKTCPFES